MVHTRQSLTGPTYLQQPAPPSPLALRHVDRRLSHTQFWSCKAILSDPSLAGRLAALWKGGAAAAADAVGRAVAGGGPA
eukprot:811179-Prymnesium_polylepis.1